MLLDNRPQPRSLSPAHLAIGGLGVLLLNSRSALSVLPFLAIGIGCLPAPTLAAPLGHAEGPMPTAAPETTLPAEAGLEWWRAVQRDIARSEYRITRAPGCGEAPEVIYQAPNRAQEFRSIFGTRGIRLVPRATRNHEAAAWECRLALAAWGRVGRDLLPSDPTRPELAGERVEYRRRGIVEWYANDARGLEQGFTIARRPEASPSSPFKKNGSQLRLELVVGGNVTAAMTADRQAVEFIVPGGARAILFDHLRATDARGQMLASWFETDANAAERLSILVDDAGATYPITIDPLATSPAWGAESDQASANFGYSVATAGDVNGDGFSDVIVGAYLFDNGQTSEGRAYVYHGSAAGLSTTANWTAESDLTGAWFGHSVATAGDVNGDGFSDVIVGAPQAGGRAYVFHGSAGGLSPTPSWTALSDQSGDSFGKSVATAGDVNNDGYSDIIVGAPFYADFANGGAGRALVYQGSASGLSLVPNWTTTGNQAGAQLGISVSTAGDVNGDGFSDVVVGANLFNNGQSGEGRALVYHGSMGGLSVTPNWTAESDQPSAWFGWSVATAGDVNGDGFSDVIVGAPQFDNGQTDEGRAYLYQGSAGGLSATASWTAESDQTAALLGASVATAGDVNGDGFADVIVGAYGFDNTLTNEGRAYVYQGSNGGLSLVSSWTADGQQSVANFGFSVATAGDVNGDGFSDVLVGARLFDNGQTDEGRAFAYRGSPGGLGASPAWTGEGGQAAADYGISVAAAGDVNGDGFGDVIVGALLFDNGETDEGRAFVYHGSTAGLSLAANWTAEGDQASAWFGTSVAAAGDVNGDGYGDVIVGANGFDNGETNEGRAFVYHGSPAGLSPTANWTAESNQAGAGFGGSVAAAGDVNGDGYGDVIVGAPSFSNGTTNEGRAFVYHGSAAGLNLTPNWTAESDQADALFGISVAGAGDVNGDGWSDVIVGAEAFDNGQTDEGRAYVYQGSSAGLSLTPNWTAESDQPGAVFGVSVATAGDVNGDGFSDVVVGSHFYDNGQTDEGRAFAYYGSATGLSPTPNWATESNQASARYGAQVATAGDVNGDGFSDVIVGAYLFDGGQTDEGRAYVYHGSTGGLSLTASWIAESNQAGASLGASVGTAGDVNGDGFSDVIVGAYFYDVSQSNEGAAFVYYGNGGSCRRVQPRQLRTDGLTPIAPLGLSDSQSQFRIASTLLSIYGRTRLKMEHEVKPSGCSFDGTGTVVDTFVDTGNDGQTDFDRLVTGLNAGRLYHWRVRATYELAKTPFQRNGPWIQVPIRGWNEADLRTAGPPVSVSPNLPVRFELRGAGPNPTRESCEALLALPNAARVHADVLDVFGRTVAVLVDGHSYEPGFHLLRWDGRDRSGSEATAGVYFLRVRSAAETRVRKVVLTR